MEPEIAHFIPCKISKISNISPTERVCPAVFRVHLSLGEIPQPLQSLGFR